MRFSTDPDYQYTVEYFEESGDPSAEPEFAYVWNPSVTIPGTGQDVLVPMVPMVAGQTGGPPGSAAQSAFITLESVATGGTVVRWPSLLGGEPVGVFLPHNMGTPWDFNPLYSGVIGIYHVMIMGQPNANLPTTPSFSVLQYEDQLLADELALSWTVIEDGLIAQAGSPGVAPPPPTGSSIVRVVSEHKHSDNDAVPDVLEVTYATDPFNPDSDGDGASDAAEKVQGTDPNDDGDQPDDSTRPTGGPPNPYGGELPQPGPNTIETVSFHFCCKHHGRWTICPDDKSIPDYKEPQWKKDSHNWPCVWTKNTWPRISATFKLPGVPETATVVARAEGSEDRDLDAQPGEYAGDELWRKPVDSPTKRWDNTIDFYNAQGGTGFELTWHVKVDSDPEEELGTTTHTVYVTLNTPVGDGYQETLYNIGCSNAKGMNLTTNTQDEIIDMIYGLRQDPEFDREFASLLVPRVYPASGARQSEPMYYWGPVWLSQPAGSNAHKYQSLEDLLKFGDASCAAWANLFKTCLYKQGIPANLLEVLPVTPPQTGVLYVKNGVFNATSTGPDPDYPWIEGTDFYDGFGLPGQGYTSPPSPLRPTLYHDGGKRPLLL